MIKDIISHAELAEAQISAAPGTAICLARGLTTGEVVVRVPRLFAPDEAAAKHYVDYFTAHIRNPHTRRAYSRAVNDFAAWCSANEIGAIHDIEPLHVASYVEVLGHPKKRSLKPPSVKQQLAALRMLFDWLVVRQVIAVNPASPVRGPKYSVKKGKTNVLTADEARHLLESIDGKTVMGRRDRALIALMLWSFARVSAAVGMRVEDAFVQEGRMWVRLKEKGGKTHDMPCHHSLEGYLHAHIDGAALGADRKGYLFRSYSRRERVLTKRPMSQADAYRMIRRRALAAGIVTKIGNHSFRATGITQYLKNRGKLEVAQQMANHESARTTGLYDRRNDQVNLDEIERIVI